MQLKRSQTMKRAGEFAMVRAAGQSETGRFLILNTAPVPPLGGRPAPSRFGIITTRRVGHAVTRNLLRRRVRELLRAYGEPLANGFYVVIIVRKRAAMTDYRGLQKDFLKLLDKHQARAHATHAQETGHPTHPVL